ncbi:hypothetical protein [Polaribacter porphyrae]|uniref:Uncharacterized protein n=1 Tax=Polaribacter porphyrae TaxID=1137780 RepID=A0A2S7WJV3_9FLAO|nr:hypothetical protein [Polaribacter porphyrae]PQJ77716.1 hypothetical protein BTO18_00300 [Polaribacter porphyrae]
MLGLILLYWIGKYFYKLAEEYNKSRWGYAILGIVVYYIGLLVLGGIVVGIVEIIFEGFIDSVNDVLLSFIALPFGILSCYLLYKYLEKTWKNNDPRKNNMIDEIRKIEE